VPKSMMLLALMLNDMTLTEPASAEAKEMSLGASGLVAQQPLRTKTAVNDTTIRFR
jgi:hypothetical protein